MRTVVIGESPARGWENSQPIVGRNDKGNLCQTGKRFLAWCELAGVVNPLKFEYYNLHGSLPPYIVRELTLRGECTVYVGLGTKVNQFLKTFHVHNRIELPHPSGRNRKLNDRRYEDQVVYQFGLNYNLYQEMFERYMYVSEHQPVNVGGENDAS
jgi:hypothetical protein